MAEYVQLTQHEEHQIRRALMVGRHGFEFPPEEGHEIQEDGWYPCLDTVGMARHAAWDLLSLKAENLKLKAELAEIYKENKRSELDMEMP